uniref:Proline and serine rich 2 n=1 Tax=Esox lucius TaxID=8010 RepID=A0A3P8ZYU1_ESOLU
RQRSSFIGHPMPIDETLQFLSQEEQECIQFFEETIDSLVDEDVEGECDGPRPHTMASSIARSLSTKDRPNSSKDQDIIDLVHSSPPDLVQPIQKPFNTPLPEWLVLHVKLFLSSDFTKNMDNPESHYENKPRREAMEHYPSEYNMHTFREDSAPYGHAQYQPVGSVPTPVLIAQKIAKNQAGGGNTNILPSSRTSISRRSLESERPPSSPDHSNKQGPPTSAKPIHYPSNINIMMGSNQHHSQAMAGVNLHDRKSQMLANLSGMSHPLVEEVMPPPVFTSMPNKVEPMPYENNSYGRKTKEVTPSHVPPSPAVTPDIVAHTLVRSPSRAQAPAPSPAPRPFRYSTPNPNRVAASPSTPPENQRKSISKPSFRSQGITVQFSGRGATDESRREALRKLGLLKDTL